MIKKYVKKPIEVEAVQWTGDNTEEIEEFAKRHIYRDLLEKCLLIETLGGDMKAMISDYIIKSANGEFYPCKPDVFKKTYEEIGGNKMTNYEKIKNMSIEEMAKMFCKGDFDANEECSYCDCTICTKEWLESEIEEGNIIEEEYPYIVKVGNNSEIHSKSEQDYINLIEDIRREAIKDCMQDEV